MEVLDSNETKTTFRSKDEWKSHLESHFNIVLPGKEQNGVDHEYYKKVEKGLVITIPKDCYKHFKGKLAKGATKLVIHEQLMKLNKEKGTGFVENNLPTKKWLVDCLYSLDPNNHLFQATPATKAKSLLIEVPSGYLNQSIF